MAALIAITLGAAILVIAVMSGSGHNATNGTTDTIPGNSIAVAAGTPITLSAFDHWMYVAAKGQASQSQPVIVPTDPPNYSGCISDSRQQIPSLKKTSTNQLKSDCAQLFASLLNQVMDFLIKAYWYEAEAASLHIGVSDARVQQELAKDKASQFPTASSFQQFLTKSGQTLPDILFRIRANLAAADLLARQTGTPKARQDAVDRQVRQAFLTNTRCAQFYAISDCGNYHRS